VAATAEHHRRRPSRAGRAPVEQLLPAAAVGQRVHQLDHHPPIAAVRAPKQPQREHEEHDQPGRHNLRRRSRVSVAATTRSTNPGGNALVNAPTDTRSGNQPSGDTPADPSCATHRSSRETITKQRIPTGVSAT
jgi:hypothetical protein